MFNRITDHIFGYKNFQTFAEEVEKNASPCEKEPCISLKNAKPASDLFESLFDKQKKHEMDFQPIAVPNSFYVVIRKLNTEENLNKIFTVRCKNQTQENGTQPLVICIGQALTRENKTTPLKWGPTYTLNEHLNGSWTESVTANGTTSFRLLQNEDKPILFEKGFNYILGNKGSSSENQTTSSLEDTISFTSTIQRVDPLYLMIGTAILFVVCKKVTAIAYKRWTNNGQTSQPKNPQPKPVAPSAS